jgi:hypothetical protein
MARNRFLAFTIGPDVMALATAKKRPTNPAERIFQVTFLHDLTVHLYVYDVKGTLIYWSQVLGPRAVTSQ